LRLLLDAPIAVWTALDRGALTAAERNQMAARFKLLGSMMTR
jgi:hypothetical protein